MSFYSFIYSLLLLHSKEAQALNVCQNFAGFARHSALRDHEVPLEMLASQIVFISLQ